MWRKLDRKLLAGVLRLLILGVLATPVAGVAEPLKTSDAARNFTAVLQVLQGDVRRLEGADLPAVQRPAVEARVKSFLNVLPLMARKYLSADAGLEQATVLRLRKLAADYRQGRSEAFGRALDGLLADFPLDTRWLTRAPASGSQIRWAGSVYANQCISCHGYQAPKDRMPAPDLFAWAHEMKLKEFAARLIVGVRGTPKIGLRNPLTKDQMAALVAYFDSRASSTQ